MNKKYTTKEKVDLLKRYAIMKLRKVDWKGILSLMYFFGLILLGIGIVNLTEYLIP